MDSEKLKLLIEEGEGLTIEFKEKYRSKIDEDIVAFANTKGGTILLGVRDDRTIAGEKLTGRLKGDINTLSRNCKPSISVNAMQVKNIVAIDVPEGDEKPYSCSSGYFRRLDGNTQKMNHEEIRVMFRENDIVPFEEKTHRDFSYKDVSRDKIAAFIKEAKLSLGKVAPEKFLTSLNLVEDGAIKNAAILMFAKDSRKYITQNELQLIAFKGTTNVIIYDRLDVRDDLLSQFNEAMRFVKKHLNIRSEIIGVNRRDILEIPEEALREAVVNAIIHRDYSIRGTSLTVHIYDDRVEITNPGGLPTQLSKKNFGKMSIRRNELIADMFSRVEKVERAGTGIRKMSDAMENAKLPKPKFEITEFFRVILYRSPEHAMKEAAGDTTKDTISDTIKDTKSPMAGDARGVPEKVTKTSGEKVGRKSWEKKLGEKVGRKCNQDPGIGCQEQESNDI